MKKEQVFFTPELGNLICEKLIKIGSLRKVCRLEGMPNKSAIFNWLLKSEQEGCDPALVTFREQYIQARKLSIDYKFDQHNEELRKAAQTPLVVDGVPVLADGKPVMVMTRESVAYARLLHDAFKWQSSKENAKKYGDRLDVTSSDGTMSPPKSLSDFYATQTGDPESSTETVLDGASP